MIYEEYPKSELIAAANFAKALTLVQIRPQQILFDNRMPKEGEVESQPAKVKLDYHGEHADPRDGYVDITIHTELAILDDSGDDGNQDENTAEHLVKVDLSLLLTFATPPEPMPKSIQDFSLPAFAKTTALTIAWPYIRHYVNFLLSESGIPAVMPILCIDAETSKNDEEQQEGGE